MIRRALAQVGIALGAAFVLSAACPAQAFSQKEAEDPLAYRAETALWWGDIETLERLYAQARANPTINRYNGRTAVTSVRAGVASGLGYGGLEASYYRELELLTRRWVDERPDSVFRRLLHVRVLYARAWHVRGGGYWQTVPAPAREEFAQLIARAEKSIADHAQLLMADTSTHVYLLMVGRSAGWPPVRLRVIADDAIARSTVDELSIYDELVTSLLPKWGGDLDRLAAFIDDVGRRTQSRLGQQLYAQLWSDTASGIQGNLFEQSRADWSRIKAGFEQLSSLYTHPHFRNRLGYLACLAKDYDTLRSVLRHLDEKPHVDAWAGGGAAGQQNYEACVAWASAPR